MTPDLDPRTKRTRSTVIAATAEILLEDGFERITIDAIAARSGVARSTIYRNWPNRAELFLDAFREMKAELEPTDVRDLAAELHAQIGALASGLMNDDWSRVLPSLIGAADQDPELKIAFQSFGEARRAELRNIFLRAVERGEIQPVENLEIVLDRIVGALFFRRLFSDREISAEVALAVTNATLTEVGYSSVEAGVSTPD